MAFEVATRLQRNGLTCEYIIGDLPQRKRQRLIDDLKAGELQYLVATDVAARGLHIEDLDLVVNYDLPEYSENYVHRIGRTARAGRTGKAVALACEEYVIGLEGIEEFIRMRIPVVRADAEMYAEDASAGMRVGHYMAQRRRDDRRDERRGRGSARGGSREAVRGAGSRARRAPALAGAAAGGDRGSAGAVAARERTTGPRAAGSDGRGEGRAAAATSDARRAAGGQGGDARGSTPARTQHATSRGDAPADGARARRPAGRRGGRGAAGGRDTREGRNGTRPESAAAPVTDATRSRAAGDGSASGRRPQGDSANGSLRSRSTEERLAYYREKYGEDFKLTEQAAPVKAEPPAGRATHRATPRNP